MATDAYSGFLAGIRAENQDFLANEANDRANQQAALTKQLNELRLMGEQQRMQEWERAAPLRDITQAVNLRTGQAALADMGAADEMRRLMAGIQLTDQNERPRPEFDIAADLMRSASLSSNPKVRQDALAIYRRAGAAQAANQAALDPQGAFARLRDLSLFPAGYEARTKGDTFEILNESGVPVQKYPLAAASAVLRDFATGEHKAQDELLRQAGQAAVQKSIADRMLESAKQTAQGQVERERIAQSALNKRNAESQAALNKRNAESQAAINARDKRKAELDILKLLIQGRQKTGGAADGGESASIDGEGVEGFDPAQVASAMSGYMQPTPAPSAQTQRSPAVQSLIDSAPTAGPVQAAPAPVGNRDIRKALQAELPGMSREAAADALETHGYAVLGPALFARLSRLKDGGAGRADFRSLLGNP